MNKHFNFLIMIVLILFLISCVKASKSEFNIPEQDFKSKYKKIAIFPSSIFTKVDFSKVKENDDLLSKIFTNSEEKSNKEIAQNVASMKSDVQFGDVDKQLTNLDKELLFRLYSSQSLQHCEVMLLSDSSKMALYIMQQMKINDFKKEDGSFDELLFNKFIKNFCTLSKADCILITYLEVVMADVFQSEAMWDGKHEKYGFSWTTNLPSGRKQMNTFTGLAPALSLTSYMITPDGKVIWEGRGGIALLAKYGSRAVVASEKNEEIYNLINNVERRKEAVKNVFYSLKLR